MRWEKFLVFNAIGAALWVGVWTTIGYVSGSHIDTIYNDATRYSTYLLAALVVLVVAYVARRLVRRRRAQPETGFGASSDRGDAALPDFAESRGHIERWVIMAEGSPVTRA